MTFIASYIPTIEKTSISTSKYMFGLNGAASMMTLSAAVAAGVASLIF